MSDNVVPLFKKDFKGTVAEFRALHVEWKQAPRRSEADWAHREALSSRNRLYLEDATACFGMSMLEALSSVMSSTLVYGDGPGQRPFPECSAPTETLEERREIFRRSLQEPDKSMTDTWCDALFPLGNDGLPAAPSLAAVAQKPWAGIFKKYLHLQRCWLLVQDDEEARSQVAQQQRILADSAYREFTDPAVRAALFGIDYLGPEYFKA